MESLVGKRRKKNLLKLNRKQSKGPLKAIGGTQLLSFLWK
jgi:hypothetical protein